MAIKTKTATREDQRGVLVELSLFPGFQGVQATGVVIILILILIYLCFLQFPTTWVVIHIAPSVRKCTPHYRAH